VSDLKIGRGFTLPLNAVTEVISVLATRGAGKSFGSADVIEELYAAELQFVVIDPMGVYWGLRSSYDGKREGLKIIVLGGERGDVPLEPTSGKLIADVVVDSGHSFVIDLSLFDSKAQQVRFMEAFCERIFYRKGPIENRTPLMIVVDEADEFAPQKPERDETKMLSHMIRLAKRGRTRGIGLLSLTQRSAEFSKAILDLSSAVVFMRTGGPRDRKAIKEWLRGSAPDLIALVDEKFPKLGTGEALVYSPHWLGLDEPQSIKFRMIKTFDSYKTPEPGEVRAAPKKVAQIDLQALGAEIAATVERAKANDPEELKRMNAELQRRLTEATQSVERLEAMVAESESRVEQVVEEVKVPVFEDGEIEELGKIAGSLASLGADLSDAAKSINNAVEKAAATVVDRVRVVAQDEKRSRRPEPIPEPARAPVPARAREEARAHANANGGIPGPQQKILDAVGWYEALRVPAPSRVQVALIAGYSHSSGGFANLLGKLRTSGLIEYPGSGNVALTPEGRALATDPGLPATNAEVQAEVLRRLPAPQARILEVLIACWPNSLTREEIAEQTNYSATSGGFANLLGKLRTGALIDYPDKGHVVALDVLFPMG
jgi:hypothetical protein